MDVKRKKTVLRLYHHLRHLSWIFQIFATHSKSLTSTKDLNNTLDTVSFVNRNRAVAIIAVWNTILWINLAIPVAAFAESFNHEGVEQSDGSWVWSYGVRVGLIIYTAELHAKLSGSQVLWDMYLTKSGGYTHFHWYTGTSYLNLTQGTWTLYKDPDNPVTYIGIEWHRNSNGTSDIKYTNIIPGDVNNGNYITHGVTTNTPYNAYYIIKDLHLNNEVDINWNKTSKDGQILDSTFFHNSLYHCWDTHGWDIVCP